VDSDRLEQVMSNLLGNALAHGDQSQPIRVELRCEPEWAFLAVHNYVEQIVDVLQEHPGIASDPGQVIRKAFRNIAQAPRETTLVREEDLTMIDAVRYAPVIFQRYVPVELDLRVTVVEDDVFAAAIRSGPDYQADYRLGLASATVTAYELPHDVAARLLDLMKALRLSFGAIDMRVTPDGEHVFLEVNPAGEYLFISERTGQPIPAAIAASLERHDRGAA
jgi:hypothetical protein